MPDIFDCDYQLQAENLITPTKRKQKNLDYIFSIVSQLQYVRDRFFDDYKKGATYLDFNIGATYSKYDRVIFTDKGVYESKTSSNLGNLPAGDGTNSTDNWRKTQDVYIGADERLLYTGQIIILVAALNKWFGITAPDYIYLVNNNGAGAGFEVYVPLAVFTPLGPTLTERKNRVRQFINNYVTAGVEYDVLSY